jgi:hypothetical protein
MNYSNLTITFQKGRRGTIIGKIVELPEILVRGANQAEVRAKIVEAFAQHQKGSPVTEKLTAFLQEHPPGKCCPR